MKRFFGPNANAKFSVDVVKNTMNEITSTSWLAGVLHLKKETWNEKISFLFACISSFYFKLAIDRQAKWNMCTELKKKCPVTHGTISFEFFTDELKICLLFLSGVKQKSNIHLHSFEKRNLLKFVDKGDLRVDTLYVT